MSNTLITTVTSTFQKRFSAEPDMLIQAPGRVNLIGEHTDYNDGFVLPAAINFQTVISVKKRDDMVVRIIAVDYDNAEDKFDLSQPISHSDQQWANYIRGTIIVLKEQGFEFNGVDMVISGNIPQGTGLSSSASLEVAVGQTFNILYDLNIPAQDIALMAQKAENDFVGCNCGIMDQLISAKGQTGHAQLIDCRSLETSAIPIPESLAILIVNSNKKRGLVDSEYNSRREQCETAAAHFDVKALRDVSLEEFIKEESKLDPVVAKRARHVITENDRTTRAAKALSDNDIHTLQQLMAASHASMRDDFEITVPEIDFLVDIIKKAIGKNGGARMTGGGFGGCVVALLPHSLVDTAVDAIEQNYEKKTGLTPSIFICSASDGVGKI